MARLRFNASFSTPSLGSGGLKVRTKMFTFDKSILKTNFNKINEGPLKHAGLLVRKIIRNSIRRSSTTRPSKPGKAPRTRKRYGYPLKRVFSVPEIKRSRVLIGHVGWNPGKETVMELHEFGGTRRVKTRFVNKRYKRKAKSAAQAKAYKRLVKQGRRPDKRTLSPLKTRTVTYPKRPFADPALKTATPKIPSMWKNSFSAPRIRGKVRS